VEHKLIDQDGIRSALPTLPFQLRTLDNQQRFDLAGVTGRLLSSSHAPEADHPNHAPMLAELAPIFEEHQQNGEIVFEYDTRVNYGQVGAVEGH
jgi:hypothetical protein